MRRAIILSFWLFIAGVYLLPPVLKMLKKKIKSKIK